MTETTYNNMLQTERDIMDYSVRAAEGVLDREANYTLASMQLDGQEAGAKGNAAGQILAVASDFLLNKFLG